MTNSDPWAHSSPDVHRVSLSPAPHVALPGEYAARGRPRWRLATVLGASATVLLLIVAVYVAMRMLASDDDHDVRQDSSSRPVERDAESRIVEGVVDGDGYRYRLPLGWVDVTDAAQERAQGLVTDTATGWAPPGGGAPSSIIVEEERLSGATLNEIASIWKRNAASQMPEDVAIVQGLDRAVAGSRAVTMTARQVPAEFGVEMDLVTYLVAEDHHFFAVTFTYPANGDSDGGLLIERTLATWQWD